MPGGGDSLTIVFVLLALVSWLLPALLKAGKNQAGEKRRAEPRQPRPDNLRARPGQTRRDYVRAEPGAPEPENPRFTESFRGARGWSRGEEPEGPVELSMLFRELLGVDEAGVSAPPPPPEPEVRRIAEAPPHAAAAPPAEKAIPAGPEAPTPGTRLVFSDHPVVQGIIFSELLAPPLCERPYDR